MLPLKCSYLLFSTALLIAYTEIWYNCTISTNFTIFRADCLCMYWWAIKSQLHIADQSRHGSTYVDIYIFIYIFFYHIFECIYVCVQHVSLLLYAGAGLSCVSI